MAEQNVLKSSIFMEQVECILDRLDAICQNNLDSNLLSKMMKTNSRASSLSQVKRQHITVPTEVRLSRKRIRKNILMY